MRGSRFVVAAPLLALTYAQTRRALDQRVLADPARKLLVAMFTKRQMEVAPAAA